MVKKVCELDGLVSMNKFCEISLTCPHHTIHFLQQCLLS